MTNILVESAKAIKDYYVLPDEEKIKRLESVLEKSLTQLKMPYPNLSVKLLCTKYYEEEVYGK